MLSSAKEAVQREAAGTDHKHLRRSVSLGEDGRDRKKDSSLTLATAQDILNASHPLRLTTQMSIDSFVVEVQDDDEEMKQRSDVKHAPYVPHLWRSVPEYLWGLWWDICRPKLTAFQVAHHRRDRGSMDSAVSELLSIPAHTLRRIRGGKNIQKSHLGLEQQLRQIAITSVPVEAKSERDGKTEGKVPNTEAETIQDSKEAQRVQKATTLVHEGHTRRAVRCLLSEGVPTISEKVIEDLRKLHPPGPSILPTCPHDAPTVLNVDKEVIKDIVIKELANGAAPGRSGWTGDLLKALVYDEQCLAGLTTLTMAIVNGELKGRAKTLLLSSVLIGLPKPNGGTRPIAMGEIFYKLAGAYMLRLVKEPAREALGSSQFAFAPGGAEAAVLCLRTALLEHPTWCIMACDIKNAFNARNRYQILETLYQHKELNAVWKIANWAYGEPSDLLVVDKGKLVEVIKSSQGVKQGDTLSSLLFALSMTRLYNGTAEQTMVKVIAVQDDVYFLGPQDAVMAAWKHFNAEVAKNTGLEINRQKTGVLVPSGTVVTRLREEGLQSSEVSIQALGTILTRDMQVLSAWLEREMKNKYQRLFRTVKDRYMPVQVAFTLLRTCAIPLVNYWMRTTPPTASYKLAEEFDKLVLQTASSILALPSPLSTVAKHQLNLPVKKGGFGLRSMMQLADVAWISAMGQAIQYCSQFAGKDKPSKQVAKPLDECVARINDMIGQCRLPGTGNDFWETYMKDPIHPGLQKELMELITDKKQEELRLEEGKRSKSDEARWRSISLEHTGLWITTTPSHQLYRVADGHFRAAARIRLGLPPHDDIRHCACGTSLHQLPQHFLSCRGLFGMNSVRHNQIRNTLMRTAASLQIAARAEPIIDYSDNARGDAVFYFRAKHTMIDVAVVNPLGLSYLDTTTREERGAAKKMEQAKTHKYADRVHRTGALFFPFVMESTGAFGPQAEKFIEKFVDDIRCGGKQTLIQGNIANHIRKVTAFALCEGNGLLYEEGIRKARSLGLAHY